MARRTFTPDQVTEMLERWHRGASTTDVAAAVGVDRKTVKKYADCAVAAGIRPAGVPQERIWRRLRAERGVLSSLATLKRWVAANLVEVEAVR
jgi:hypothetical protein